MNTLRRWWNACTNWLQTTFSYRQKITLIVLSGIIVGGASLFFYLLRMHTYLGDDPAACVNCHIMSPYYATWSHSSHHRDATCNDCHVPHQNAAMKYGFKALDGLKHTTYFIAHSERQAIMAEKPSAWVIMDNCIRCHRELTQEMVSAGRINYFDVQKGDGKACWDCHRNVPHGGMNSLCKTPWAETQVPLPPSPVPAWIQNLVND